jgi:L-amino acid N-acyltransferase YncA
MDYTIRKATEKDSAQMGSIFNYFIRKSFAAFPIEEMEEATFFENMKNISHPDSVYVVESGKKIIGFGIIKRYYASSVFNRAAEVGYFLLPTFTGHGAGSELLKTMEKDAKALGVETMLASISSLNQGSIKFHKKHGFSECANFKKVGRKKDQDFDVIWMQKEL